MHTKQEEVIYSNNKESEDDTKTIVMVKSNQRKQRGWKTMPYILGNETFERLATLGVVANIMVYMRREYHMDQVVAASIINVYYGVANFAPLLGAFISDAYIGRFSAILIGSFASFLGILTLTLTAWIPSLKPQWCRYNDRNNQIQAASLSSCSKPNMQQLSVLIISFGLLSIGTGCIRPCSIPFGVDQFNLATDRGRRGINSYYSWYYTTLSLVVVLTLTAVVYVQDSVSWVWGFGIPTGFMFCSIVLFLFGTRLYVYVKPEDSVFSNILRVFVAVYKKRHLELPGDVKEGKFYDPSVTGVVVSKLPLTNQLRNVKSEPVEWEGVMTIVLVLLFVRNRMRFNHLQFTFASFLNKAGIILEGEINQDGTPKQTSKWTLCSIQHIEEVKCLIKVLPIWASLIICSISTAQQPTITVSQAMLMNRHIGPKFLIPPGSIIVVSMLTLGIWVPIYDRIVIPRLRKFTKHEEGISLLQRLGIGLVLSIVSMVISGLVEQRRRYMANNHHKNMSIMWLVPQLAVLGLSEAFSLIAQIEFYNKQFPENMSSMATSLAFCSAAGANYLSATLVGMVHELTAKHGTPSWLTNDLNQGRVDWFYYLLAILGCFNLVYFLIVAKKYRYKEIVIADIN